jgi:hypothetical protein
MPAPYPQSVGRHGICYTLLEPLGPRQARFTFRGRFQSAAVLWDTTLIALGAPGPTDTDRQRRDYIEIGGPVGDRRPLTVALAIPAIDEAAVLRTIIMIRQYKRLRAGRMLFGRS